MKVYITILSLFFAFAVQSQNKLSKLLKQYNTESVPYIYVEDIDPENTETLYLDAREPIEYEVSHLQNATCVGFDYFDISKFEETHQDKSQEIVVYCSLGIRSEIVAKQLIDAGYTNVKNLYGGIFEWKNANQAVYNLKEVETDSVHAFSKEWSKWLKKGIKVYPTLKHE